MHVSAAFDAGNIDVVSASDPGDVRLAIRADASSEHRQWFYFRITGARGVPLTLKITNAGACSYPNAWIGSRAVVSSDRQSWTRADTEYVDGELIISITPSSDTLSVAYFAPFSHERHLDLVDRTAATAGVVHSVLGRTLDGRDLDLLTFGEPGPERRSIWVIGRQHPGETMASFWMEGFLARLADPEDALARQLRERAVIYVVPHMNPDGAIRGHLRTNAAGVNLNRVWDAPDLQTCPEVKLVRDAMDRTGVDLCLDVHGDEELPYTFVSGAEGIPGWSARLAGLQDTFCDAYERANPDFQRVHGYPIDAPGSGNMSMCTNQVAERFDALAMTLEMPFKDNADAPDPVRGWSPGRCQRMGASAVDPIMAVLGDLR